MISVLPSKDSLEIKNLFEKHNRKFLETSGCVIAREKDNVLGYCLYYLEKDKMTVLEINPESDLPLADGLLRSAIHNGVLSKVIKVYYDEKSPVEVFNKLQFILSDEDKTLDASKLFKSCCSCSDKNT